MFVVNLGRRKSFPVVFGTVLIVKTVKDSDNNSSNISSN